MSQGRRIPTTHVGSLPRPQEVVDLVFAEDRDEAVDPAEYDRVIGAAVQDRDLPWPDHLRAPRAGAERPGAAGGGNRRPARRRHVHECAVPGHHRPVSAQRVLRDKLRSLAEGAQIAGRSVMRGA